MEWIKVNDYINPSLYKMDRIITVLNIYTHIYYMLFSYQTGYIM
jgi:hypothetical protein